jgi:protein O-GlcNAc transferase
MKKVISFSLWGSNPTYNIGAIKNAELAKIFYPDFECWFYIHIDTVPKKTIDTLKSFTNTKIIYKAGDLTYEICKPRMWRYESIDDPEVEIMLSRDTDTRIWLREKLAVDEWIKSNKLFHIMRDHPHHNFTILGGMFGTRKIPQISNWTYLINKYNKTDNRMYDQDFLKDNIYSLIKNNSLIHASFNKIEPHAKNFPITYCKDFKFVGEYVYYDDSRSNEHINILKQNLKTISNRLV